MTPCKVCGGSVGWSCDCDPEYVASMASHEAKMAPDVIGKAEDYPALDPNDVFPF